MIEWLRRPENRVRSAWVLFWVSIVGWLSTHALMLLTRPAGATSWVFHLLLALSWLAVTFTALNIIVTTDVRREQEE